MNNEIKLVGSSAHGDKKTASKNTHHEKRISIKINNEDVHFKR